MVDRAHQPGPARAPGGSRETWAVLVVIRSTGDDDEILVNEWLTIRDNQPMVNKWLTLGEMNQPMVDEWWTIPG